MGNEMKVDSCGFIAKQDWQKADFARSMNCSVDLLNRIDNFTTNLSTTKGSLKRDFIGNLERRFCGRFYSSQDFLQSYTFNLAKIWIGVYFDRFWGYRLMVSFHNEVPEKDTACIPFLRRIMDKHLPIYAEYDEKDLGYWFSVPFPNFLESDDDVKTATNVVQDFIKDVIR